MPTHDESPSKCESGRSVGSEDAAGPLVSTSIFPMIGHDRGRRDICYAAQTPWACPAVTSDSSCLSSGVQSLLPIRERNVFITACKGNVPFPYANCRKRGSIGTFGFWDITACAFPRCLLIGSSSRENDTRMTSGTHNPSHGIYSGHRMTHCVETICMNAVPVPQALSMLQ